VDYLIADRIGGFINTTFVLLVLCAEFAVLWGGLISKVRTYGAPAKNDIATVLAILILVVIIIVGITYRFFHQHRYTSR